jgi:hypothetical protein
MRKNIPLLLILLVMSACSALKDSSPSLSLASFTENSVTVSIQLEEQSNGSFFLAATFTPMPGGHLYSKDIPLTGVDGLGRPTLLELSANSSLAALGALIESVPAEEPDTEPKALLVYPPGPVTLRLPVQLPPGGGWVLEQIKITYMACDDIGCKPPVMGKTVEVRIPQADALK